MRIWDRRVECYGASEVIEDAIFNQVENFPMLSNRDYQKLREYGELLTKPLSAKEDGNIHRSRISPLGCQVIILTSREVVISRL